MKLRFFAGMTLAEAARALGISERTADRYWVFARTWLADAMSRGQPGHSFGFRDAIRDRTEHWRETRSLGGDPVPESNPGLMSIFTEALDRPDPAERAAYLDRACGGDTALRRRVDELLDAHPGVCRFLEPDATSAADGGSLVASATETGAQVPDRATGTFENTPTGREPAGATEVFDGGTTERGQPYFIMELVQGVPLTDYCDQRRLGVPARLDLFVSVCQAVQQAHQKGIIHRDLKPGNVLVAEIDGRPTPKVIDFGVAKATELKLTDLSFADTGAIVGTPAYRGPP